MPITNLNEFGQAGSKDRLFWWPVLVVGIKDCRSPKMCSFLLVALYTFNRLTFKPTLAGNLGHTHTHTRTHPCGISRRCVVCLTEERTHSKLLTMDKEDRISEPNVSIKCDCMPPTLFSLQSRCRLLVGIFRTGISHSTTMVKFSDNHYHPCRASETLRRICGGFALAGIDHGL